MNSRSQLAKGVKALFSVLVFMSTANAQVLYQSVIGRADAVTAFFSSQQNRLLVWNAIWMAHRGQILFGKCLGSVREMATTVDDKRVSSTWLRTGWPATQFILIHKNIGTMVAGDGMGPVPAGGGLPPGGRGDDPKYLTDGFLGGMFHEIIHAVAQEGDYSDTSTQNVLECQAFGSELLYYLQIKDLDPCYTAPVPGGALRRIQLCNRIDATRKLANKDHCGF